MTRTTTDMPRRRQTEQEWADGQISVAELREIKRSTEESLHEAVSGFVRQIQIGTKIPVTGITIRIERRTAVGESRPIGCVADVRIDLDI